MILSLCVLFILFNGLFAQQWPAQIISMNAAGHRFSRQTNTFPMSAIGGGQGGGYPMGSMGFPQMRQQGNPFGGMQQPQMRQQGNPFGGMQQSQMPSQSLYGGSGSQMPSRSFFGGSGGQMPFLPVQQQYQRQSFGGYPSQGFPMSMGQQSGSQMQFHLQQHPRQFGQKQFQPMASFQQNAPPQQQQQQLTNSIQEAPTSGGSLPKFLEGAPEETITEFKRIIRQPNVTYDNKIKEVEQLVSNLDETHQKLYHQFMDESDKTQQTKRNAIHKTVEGMSEDAQNQFTKISAILQNPALPEEERWNKILTIYGSLEPSLRNEFEEKFKPLV